MYAVLLMLALSAPSPEVIREAELLAAKGVASYRAQAFEAAGDYFYRAYQLSGEPTQLRNSAKAFDDAGQKDRARKYWGELLELDGLSPTDRAEAEARYAEPPLPRVEKKDALAEMTAVMYPAPSSQFAPWIIGATGLAAISGGVVLYVVSSNKRETLVANLDYREDGKITGTRYEDAVHTKDEITRMRIGSGLAVGLGVAAVTTSIVWLSSSDTEKSLAIVPVSGGALAAFGAVW
jgi:hypothetical protein